MLGSHEILDHLRHFLELSFRFTFLEHFMRSILGLVSLILVPPCFSYQFYHIAMVESCNNTFGFILASRNDGA
jgi:hypothetical protein